MVISKKVSLFFCISFLSCSIISFSYWAEPVLLSELNGVNPPVSAGAPCIASDGMSIFFSRKTTPGVFSSTMIFEAWKDDADGLFVNSKALTELYNGDFISDPWISEDGLRLYYVEIEYSSVLRRHARLLKMATREDIGLDWRTIRSHPELCLRPLGNICSCVSLTADELTILWYSRDSEGLVPSKVMVASRPSIDHDFSDIQEVPELNDFNALCPYLSADGLMVYFSRINPDGFYDLWQGSRASLDEPFGDFAAVEALNQPTTHSLNPCVSPDGQSLYFVYGGPDIDIADKGIYVSHWIDPPFDIAVRNLDEAIALKEQATEMVDLAMEKEAQALEILASLPPEQTPDHLTAEQIHEARIHIMQALRRQVVARDNLRRGLVYLNSALLGILPPVWIDEPVEPAP